jgi:hypothetical protein
MSAVSNRSACRKKGGLFVDGLYPCTVGFLSPFADGFAVKYPLTELAFADRSRVCAKSAIEDKGAFLALVLPL